MKALHTLANQGVSKHKQKFGDDPCRGNTSATLLVQQLYIPPIDPPRPRHTDIQPISNVMLLSDALTISLRHKENIISRYPCTPKLLSSTCILIYIDIEIAVKKKIHLSAADEEEFKFALGLLEAKFCSSQMPIISRLAPFFSAAVQRQLS